MNEPWDWAGSGPIATAAGYLLGSIPFGLLLGKLSGGTDVRRTGSGNIGATNVARSVGMSAGVVTLALDLGKGAAAVWLGRSVTGEIRWALLAGLAALLGHVFPVFLRFRGGKGVATGCGVFLALEPFATLWAAAVFGGVVLATRRVSFASIAAAASLPLVLGLREAPPPLIAGGLASAALIIVRHRENIRRILSGTEPRWGEGRR